MTGLDDVPLISSASEVRSLEISRPVKTINVENGNLFSNFDGGLSPETEAASPKEDPRNEGLQSSSSHELVGAVSDAGEISNETSSPDSCSRMEDDVSVDGQSLVHCFDGWSMADGERGIVFHPDFVKCHRLVCHAKPVVVFLASCIEVKCLAANGDQEDFHIQLRLDDITNIETRWIGMVQIAEVRIRLSSNGAMDAEGAEELKFAVKDPCWYEKQEAIQSLDVRYNAIWNVKIDTEMDEYGETEQKAATPRYFPEFEHFEDFIYPEGDSDAVSISKRDVDLLEPDTFLNDTIIDFYIKYLKDKIPPEKRQKYHFFNSFFFRKLGDLEKYPSGAFDGRAAFERVRKWTRKVNLFEKDFIFIPVNHNYHWSLLVICHPGEVANFRGEDVKKLDRVPCILHMDSIRGTHMHLKDRIQSYLWEEWKERQKETSEEISSKFSDLRFVSLELPQQQNSYDCGLFLLHYVESFLKEDPVNISPFKIRHKFLTGNWFRTTEPSLKRHEIWKLIHDLLKRHSRESSPATDSKECRPSNSYKNENPVAILSQSFSPSRDCNGNLPCTQVEKGIEMTLFPASLSGAHCANNSGAVAKDPFEAGSAAGALLDMHFQPFDRSTSFNEFKTAMASIEENVETSGTFVYATSTENSLQNLAGIATQACDYPCPSRDFRAEVSWNPEVSIHQTAKENPDSSTVTSLSHSDKALEAQVVKKCEGQVEKDEAVRETNLDNETRHTSAENNECLIDCFPSAPGEMLIVSDSHCSIQSLESNDSSNPPGALPKNVSELSDHGNGMDRNRSRTCNDGDDSASDSDMQPAAKKLRLTPSSEELTNGLPKDLCL